MIDLVEHADGIILPVKAAAGSRENAVRGAIDGALKVAVTQKAEKGKANKAIVAVLARFFGLRKSQIELIAGMTQANKRFLLRDVSQSDIAAKLTARS